MMRCEPQMFWINTATIETKMIDFFIVGNISFGEKKSSSMGFIYFSPEPNLAIANICFTSLPFPTTGMRVDVGLRLKIIKGFLATKIDSDHFHGILPFLRFSLMIAVAGLPTFPRTALASLFPMKSLGIPAYQIILAS